MIEAIAGGAAGGAASGTVSGISGAAASKVQWSRTKRMMQKRHQWEVADLRAAGLNPILSAGAAPSMGSVPAAQTAKGSEVAQGALIASHILLNKAGAEKATADASLSEAKEGAIQPASTIGKGVGSVLDAAGGAARTLFDGFTGPQSNTAPKLRLPDQSQFMKSIKRKQGESIWEFTKRKFLLWKAFRNNDMNNPNWSPN